MNGTFLEHLDNKDIICDGTSYKGEATAPTREEGRGSKLRASG